MSASGGLVSIVVVIAGVFLTLWVSVAVLRAGLAPVQEELSKIALELRLRDESVSAGNERP
jgi:hypothetical protein